MPRKPTGRPTGRPKGSGTLGEITRFTVRLPTELYTRLELFAEGRSYTRGTPELSGCVRDLLEHALACPYKRQTQSIPLPSGDNNGQTENIPELSRDEIQQTIIYPEQGRDKKQQTENIPRSHGDILQQTQSVPTLSVAPAAPRRPQTDNEQVSPTPRPLDAADVDAIPLGESVAIAPPPAAADVLDYDPEKFSLGKLCPRQHAYQNTGQTLLTVKGRRCLPCEAAKKREKRSGANRP